MIPTETYTYLTSLPSRDRITPVEELETEQTHVDWRE